MELFNRGYGTQSEVKFNEMPSFVPRLEPAKKEQQLARKKLALKLAIRNNLSEEKLTKAAEKYHAAQLSLFRATIHVIHERNLK
ncbi:MAG: hypothetical protein IPM82_09385 [Saprospiraceae bacterium]|nr:hypothetical protein [Saprospiraceae bacterium]